MRRDSPSMSEPPVQLTPGLRQRPAWWQAILRQPAHQLYLSHPVRVLKFRRSFGISFASLRSGAAPPVAGCEAGWGLGRGGPAAPAPGTGTRVGARSRRATEDAEPRQEERMRTRSSAPIALLAGCAIGAAAMTVVHAQATPPAYSIVEVDVIDAEGFKAFAHRHPAGGAAGGGPFHRGAWRGCDFGGDTAKGRFHHRVEQPRPGYRLFQFAHLQGTDPA